MKNIWVPISGALAQQKKVEVIANNVANANTPGFKKDAIVFKEHLTALTEKGAQDINLPNKEWAPEDFYRSYGAENAHVKVDGTFTVHEQGQLTPTGNLLDVALRGNGFLEVLTPNGTRFTRRGILSLNSEGQLVTDQGYFVLSKQNIENLDDKESLTNPNDRKISIPQGKLTINLNGELYSSGQQIGNLSVVEFKDLHTLKKEGNSLYVNNKKDNFKVSNLKTTIHQGFIEESNVNAVQEMTNLIKANRQFESIQRAIKTFDNIAGKEVNDIARF